MSIREGYIIITFTFPFIHICPFLGTSTSIRLWKFQTRFFFCNFKSYVEYEHRQSYFYGKS